MIQRNFHPSNGRERIHHKVQGNREIKTKSRVLGSKRRVLSFAEQRHEGVQRRSSSLGDLHRLCYEKHIGIYIHR